MVRPTGPDGPVEMAEVPYGAGSPRRRTDSPGQGDSVGQPEGEGIGTYRRPPTGRTAGLRQTLGPGYRRRRDRSESKATHSTTSTDPTTTHSPVDPAADSSRRRQWLTGTALAVVLAAGVTAVPNVDNPDAGRAPATAGHRHGVQAGPRLLAGGGLPSRQLYGWGATTRVRSVPAPSAAGR